MDDFSSPFPATGRAGPSRGPCQEALPRGEVDPAARFGENKSYEVATRDGLGGVRLADGSEHTGRRLAALPLPLPRRPPQELLPRVARPVGVLLGPLLFGRGGS